MRLTAGVVALAFLASACGGEKERLSRQEYVRQVDAICKKFEDDLDALEEPANADEVAAFVDEAHRVAEDGVADLKELKPPAELEAKVDAWLELNDERVKEIGRAAEATKSGDVSAIVEIAREAEETDEKADALAREIGLDECVEA